MASSSMKKVTVKTSDGEIFEVDDLFVNESQKIKAHLISDRKFTDDAIPLPNISSETLSMVIEYVKKHTESGSDDKSLNAWDAEFIMKGDINKLYNLITAANDLGNKRLLDLACLTTADIIKGKNPEQIRQIFNIECDFTPQEEEEHRRMFPTFY